MSERDDAPYRAEIGDAPDQIWVSGGSCPNCDVDDRNGDNGDDGDDDFHGCDDCNDLDDAGAADDAGDATEVIADIAEGALDILAAILMENDELVDGERVLRRLQSAAKRLKNNPSIAELIAARRRAVSKE